MNRWKASGIHLAFSAAVCAVLLLVIVSYWFPGILFRFDGGWTGLKIVVGVDVVLGPLLTLVVFKVGKPGLKFDLGCIITMQIACLAAGIWVVFKERPLALVYAFDTFYSITAQEFKDFGKDPSVLDNIPGTTPKLVLVRLPEDQEQAALLVLRSEFTGDPLFMQTDRYIPFPDDATTVMQRREVLAARMAEDSGTDPLQIDGNCLLARFVSARNVGYVCYDEQRKEIDRYLD